MLSSPLNQREVTKFEKGGNLQNLLLPPKNFGIFLFEIKILTYIFLEHLPYIHIVNKTYISVNKQSLGSLN